MRFKYLLNGIKYFIIQTLLETLGIVLLMYFGWQYSGMSVGGESLWEVIIGVLGYHAFFKCVIYSWIYVPLFIGISFIKKYRSQFAFSLINAFLSLLLPLMILVIRGLNFSEMKNVFLSTVLTSILITLVVKFRENKIRPLLVPKGD